MKQRLSTIEEYRKQMNIVLEYIDNHLDELIDLAKLAEVSNFSPYHFHRITRVLVGEPIGAYIVRRRVETAAQLLRYTDISVSDIAYKVGYDVPSSLSKAFKQQYGISPADYRSDREFRIIDKPQKEIDMEIKGPKIVNLSTKKAIYIKLSGGYLGLDYSGAWAKLWTFVKEHKLFSLSIEHIAIYHNDPKVTDETKLAADVCLTIKKDVKPEGEIGVKEIPGGKYAMFLYKGPYDNLGLVYDTIYNKLLLENNLKIRNVPNFEKYLNNPDKTKPEKLKTEIYIPVE